MVNDTEKIVDVINSSPYMGVIAITGGGTGAIGKLLRKGGGSATLLEAVVPYSMEAWNAFIGKRPERAVPEVAARQLAMTAYLKARSLRPGPNLFGLGATSALVKNDEREGRKHHSYIAVQTDTLCRYFVFELYPKDREIEESLIDDAIIAALAFSLDLPVYEAVHELEKYGYISTKRRHGNDQMLKLVTSDKSIYWRPFFGDTTPDVADKMPNTAIYSISANPLHSGHMGVLDAAEKILGIKPLYEISVTNVDKPPLDFYEIRNRMEQFNGANNLLLSNAPLFHEKSELFPDSWFIVGVDTWRRINDPQYYGGLHGLDYALSCLFRNNAKFLVFGREVDGKFVGATDVDIALPLHSFFMTDSVRAVPENVFRMDISSSELRCR